jgi:hypothetical protein
MEKLFRNVHRDGNNIFSYNTHVATIEGSNLIELAKYSTTTSTHISKVAVMLGLEVVNCVDRKKVEFDKLDYGANINF